MKMKKNKKIIFILIFVLIIVISSSALAAESELTNGIEITSGKTKEFEDVGNTILGVLQIIGIISSVIALMFMGIKYMMGSIEEKAEYKNSFKVYIIGALLVFGVSTFTKVLYNLIKEIQ